MLSLSLAGNIHKMIPVTLYSVNDLTNEMVVMYEENFVRLQFKIGLSDILLCNSPRTHAWAQDLAD